MATVDNVLTMAPCPAAREMGQDRLDTEERAVAVDPPQGLEGFGCLLAQRFSAQDSGVVDQPVEPAETRNSAIDGRAPRTGIGDVEVDGEDMVGPLSFELGDIRPHIDGDDLGTGRHQPLRDRPALAASRPGHEDDPARHVVAHPAYVSWLRRAEDPSPVRRSVRLTLGSRRCTTHRSNRPR